VAKRLGWEASNGLAAVTEGGACQRLHQLLEDKEKSVRDAAKEAIKMLEGKLKGGLRTHGMVRRTFSES
jgi:hypothetical protein